MQGFELLQIFFCFLSAVHWCVSISGFASLTDVSVGIASSAIGLKICALSAGIEKCKSIIKEKEKKDNNILFLGNTKLNTIKVLISLLLILTH